MRPICFGLYLHPCHEPTDMTIYIEVHNNSAQNFSFVKTVAGDQDFEIKGLYFHQQLLLLAHGTEHASCSIKLVLHECNESEG